MIIARWAALLVLASASSLLAHHALTQFDTTTGVTLKGTVVRFERVNPHSFLYIDAKGKNGDTQLWAIEGPNINQLVRMGFEKDTLKAGDVIEACGYILKEGQYRHFLTGELLVLPDGRKLSWLDYGHHKCLGPDYKDIHSN
jgi:hypothetical protein